MITLDYSPIEVDLNVETGNLIQDAFYTIGFVTENDSAPRTLEVHSLQDLLDNGYTRGSNAYNFCKGVLIQGKMNTIIVRAKRANESYVEAYEADDNSSYYYVVIGSKDISTILSFNDRLISLGDIKLQLFSSSSDHSDLIIGRKLIYYYQEDFTDFPYIAFDSSAGVLLDSSSIINVDPFLGIQESEESPMTNQDLTDISEELAQARTLQYPEAAWAGLCGFYFPSQIQWLYKNIQNVNASNPTEIPNLSTTSVLFGAYKDKSTLGSGTDCTGYPINEVVSLDWVKYALRKRLWEVLYNSEKVSSNKFGLSILENVVKSVLDTAVQLEIFESYKLTDSKIVSTLGRASFKFEAILTQTILEVKKVEGTIYH